MENFGKFMTLVLILIINPIMYGFVVSKLWFWFIVPTFQMQPLRIVEAIGIIFLINFIRMKRDKEANSEKFWVELVTNIFFVVFMSSFTLLFGWIASLFM